MTLDFEIQTIILLIGLVIGAFLSYPLFLILTKYKILQRTARALISFVLITMFLSIFVTFGLVMLPYFVAFGVWEAFRDNEITDFRLV